jgi:hypothetical protein
MPGQMPVDPQIEGKGVLLGDPTYWGVERRRMGPYIQKWDEYLLLSHNACDGSTSNQQPGLAN